MQNLDPNLDEFLEAFVLNYRYLHERLAPPPLPLPEGPERLSPFEPVEANLGGDDMEAYFGVEPADPNAPVFDLTQDLLYKVFSHLDAPGLCSVAQVCRQWGRMSVHEDFWHTLDLSRKELHRDEIVAVCRKFGRATTVLLGGGNRLDEELVQKALGRLRGLTSLSIRDTHASLPAADLFFRALTLNCRGLRHLSVTESLLTSPNVVINHSELETLVLDANHCHGLRVSCPVLRTLSLERAIFSSLILECPLLRSFRSGGCNKMGDLMLRSALVACPELRSVDVSGCALMTDDSMRQVAAVCLKVQRLDTSHCPLLTFANIRFPALREFISVGCEGVTTSCVNMFGHSPHLESLTLDYCWKLVTLELELGQLRSLSLINCRTLADVRLRTPHLSVLNLGSCVALRKVDIYSAELRSLALRAQPLLREVKLRGPELTSLSLTECDGLQELGGAGFLDAEACPKLGLLILDTCEGLSQLSLCSPSLSRLSLAGCSSLRAVDLACPALTSLHTEGCNRLARARLAPVALADVSLGTCPHLASLMIQSAGMEGLDLRGCGALGEVELDCPAMTRLDTSYCSKLSSLTLAPLTAKCRSLSTLILAGAITSSDGLVALSELPMLSKLDLSYTEIESLEPIFQACSQLEVLLLSACKRLPDSALTPLHFGCNLPRLDELDASYCNLSARAVGDMVAQAPHIARLSFNGCTKVDDSIWERLAECPGTPTGQSEGGPKCPEGPTGQSMVAGIVEGGDLAEVVKGPQIGGALGGETRDTREESPGRSEGAIVQPMGSPLKLTKRLGGFNLGGGEGLRGEARQRVLMSYDRSSVEDVIAERTFSLGSGRVEPAERAHLEKLGESDALVGRESSMTPVENVFETDRETPTGPSAAGRNLPDPRSPLIDSGLIASRIGGDCMEVDPVEARSSSWRHSLTSLSLVGCNGLRSVRIGGPGQCPGLTDLNVSLCGNVRQASIACPRLVQLNLSQCGMLASAEVDCPNVRVLNVQGSLLDDPQILCMVRGCLALETLDVRSCARMQTVDESSKALREMCPGLRRLHFDAH